MWTDLLNRFLVRYDSAVSHIDTTVHYRYFTVEERLTDLKRSILEQDVNATPGSLHAAAIASMGDTDSSQVAL